MAKLRPCYFTDLFSPTGCKNVNIFTYTFVYEFTNVNRCRRQGGRAEGARVGRGGSRQGGKSGAGAGVGMLRAGVGMLSVAQPCEALCGMEWSGMAL